MCFFVFYQVIFPEIFPYVPGVFKLLYFLNIPIVLGEFVELIRKGTRFFKFIYRVTRFRVPCKAKLLPFVYYLAE